MVRGARKEGGRLLAARPRLMAVPFQALAVDPLPSWNEGAGCIPPEARITTFDNEGTHWPEQPLVQGAFLRANGFQAGLARHLQHPASAGRWQPSEEVLRRVTCPLGASP